MPCPQLADYDDHDQSNTYDCGCQVPQLILVIMAAVDLGCRRQSIKYLLICQNASSEHVVK